MSATNPSTSEHIRRGAPQLASTSNTRENEPLLGRPGDVVMAKDQSFAFNLIQGTAPLAQVGGLVLLVLVWAGVFLHKLIVFDGHPMLNTLGILFVIQAILILQPTGLYDLAQKKRATYIHAIFAVLAAASFIAAISIVIWHKEHSHIPHLESSHSKVGLVTYILILLQVFVGFTQFFLPSLYGGEENAKKIYKYHRLFGYAIILPLLLITVILATKTRYGAAVLKIKTWAVVLASVAIVAGIYPRIKLGKLWGYRRDEVVNGHGDERNGRG